MPFVYILKCADGTLYTGSTTDLEKRLYEHNHTTAGAKYTRARRPVSLYYSEKKKTLSAARSREAHIKQLNRVQKLALNTTHNKKLS
jgi:putative endonuclease